MTTSNVIPLLSNHAARAIAYDWHGGQASGLYSFASTGRTTDVGIDHAIREVRYELAHLPGGAAHSDHRRLRNLLAYLEDDAHIRGLVI